MPCDDELGGFVMIDYHPVRRDSVVQRDYVMMV